MLNFIKSVLGNEPFFLMFFNFAKCFFAKSSHQQKLMEIQTISFGFILGLGLMSVFFWAFEFGLCVWTQTQTQTQRPKKTSTKPKPKKTKFQTPKKKHFWFWVWCLFLGGLGLWFVFFWSLGLCPNLKPMFFRGKTSDRNSRFLQN